MTAPAPSRIAATPITPEAVLGACRPMGALHGQGPRTDVDVGVLVVGDAAAGSRIQRAARLGGLGASRVSDPAEVEAAFAASPSALIILESGRPQQVDFSAVRRLGHRAFAPLLVVMDHDDEADRYLALELGADDCVSSGCSDRELLARIRALSRRANARRPSDPPGEIEFNGFRLGLACQTLRGPDGREVKLSRAERRLLSLFVCNPGRILTQAEISRVCGDGDEILSRGALRLRVSRLRRGLQRADPGASVIRSVHGLGYLFEPRFGTRRSVG